MDWTKQLEEMNTAWVQTQQKMWNNWAESAQNMNQKQMNAAWRSMIDAWQMSMNQLLDTQVDGMRLWVDNVEALPNMPQGASQGAHEWMLMYHDMTQQWTDTQKQLWNNWFALVKEFKPEQMGEQFRAPSSAGEPMLKFWRDAVQTMNSAQTEWTKTWGTMNADANK